MSDLVAALALVLAVEGLFFAAFPEAMRRAMRDAAQMPGRLLRGIGLLSAVLGIVLIWASRGWPQPNFW